MILNGASAPTLILVSINATLIYVMIPITFAIMAIPSKIDNGAEIKKTKEKSSFDIMKEMHKQPFNPPLE